MIFYFSLSTKYVSASYGQCNISVIVPLHLKQGEDVALPEVPTEPVPEVPEAVKAEQGKGFFFL